MVSILERSFIDAQADIRQVGTLYSKIVFVKCFSGSSTSLNSHFQVNPNVCFVQKTIHIIRWSMTYSGKSRKKGFLAEENRHFMRK